MINPVVKLRCLKQTCKQCWTISGNYLCNIILEEVVCSSHPLIVETACEGFHSLTSFKSLRLRDLLTFCYLLLPFVTFGYLSLFLVTFPGLTEPYWALLGLTGPYWALLGLTLLYWALLGLSGPYFQFAD